MDKLFGAFLDMDIIGALLTMDIIGALETSAPPKSAPPKCKRGVSTLLIHLFRVLWVVMDSNHRRHRQQIYSLPHLATLVTTQ